MNRPENPYAFPLQAYRDPANGNFHNESEFGMSLEDWFAGQALAGCLANPDIQMSVDALADFCYRQAHAMLVRRMQKYENKIT